MVSQLQSIPLYVVYFGLLHFALPIRARRPRASQAARVVSLLRERVHVLPAHLATVSRISVIASPQMAAASGGHVELLELLVNARADLDPWADDGRSCIARYRFRGPGTGSGCIGAGRRSDG